MICNDDVCNCAIVSTTLDITGSGTPSDPLVIEQSEFSDLDSIHSDIANINAELNALPATFVNVTGDDMTEKLEITAANAALVLKRTGDAPFMEWRKIDGTRLGFAQVSAAYMFLQAETGVGITLRTDGSNDRFRILADGTILVHKTSSSVASIGQEMPNSGGFQTTVDSSGSFNLYANRTGTANADTQVYASFRQAGTQIGRIERASVTSATYTASSDKDLKENIAPIDDELALLWLRLVEPVFFTEKADPEHRQRVGYIAQDVDAVWPNGTDTGVISKGHGNAEDRTWDDLGNETTPDDVWSPWAVAYERAGVYVHAASKVNDRRLSEAEAKLVAQARQIAALDARVAALEGARA